MLLPVGAVRRPRRRAAGRGRHRRRRPLPLAGLLLAAALAAAGAWWLSGHHHVVLLVDGRASEHETHAATVGEFLARAGVTVAPADEVVPDPDTPLATRQQVEVRRARDVTLVVGDTEHDVTARALSVDGLLAGLDPGLLDGEAGPRRLLHPSRLSRVRSGMVVELSDPVAVTLAVSGRSEEVVSSERTVAGLLEEAGVRVGPDDRVTPALDAPLEHGMSVTVERVEVRTEQRREAVPFTTVEEPSAGLLRGERREAREGRPGERVVTEEVVLVDGVEESRTVVGDEVTVEPVAQVVEVGTAEPEPTPEPAPEPPAEPAAQAEPEPSAPPGTGEQQSGQASWYRSPFGDFAAAHRTLPRGTVVTVTNLDNGRSVQVRIADRGPYVDGRVIDLDDHAFRQLAPLSSGVARVRIEW